MPRLCSGVSRLRPRRRRRQSSRPPVRSSVASSRSASAGCPRACPGTAAAVSSGCGRSTAAGRDSRTTACAPPDLTYFLSTRKLSALCPGGRRGTTSTSTGARRSGSSTALSHPRRTTPQHGSAPLAAACREHPPIPALLLAATTWAGVEGWWCRLGRRCSAESWRCCVQGQSPLPPRRPPFCATESAGPAFSLICPGLVLLRGAGGWVQHTLTVELEFGADEVDAPQEPL